MTIKEKIEILFKSPDKELQKLGQKLCHIHRINYYIHAWRTSAIPRIWKYSLISIEEEVKSIRYIPLGDLIKSNSVEFEIKLNKNERSEVK